MRFAAVCGIFSAVFQERSGLNAKSLFCKLFNSLGKSWRTVLPSPIVANDANLCGISRHANDLTIGFILLLALAPCRANANTLEQALSSTRQAQQASSAAQQQVDALDDAARALLQEYQQVLAELDQVQARNRGLERAQQAQQSELRRLEAELLAAASTDGEIIPLIERMQTVLAEFVARDLAFLSVERSARLARLQALGEAPDSALTTRYRALLEAYQIESSYGLSIEAYRGRLEDGSDRLVEFLRLGRVALYYRTLDGAEAGARTAADRQWRPLDAQQGEQLARALRVARKELPPDLLLLPVPAARIYP